MFAAPRHPYTRMLLESVPLLDPDARTSAAGGACGVRGEMPSPVDARAAVFSARGVPTALPDMRANVVQSRKTSTEFAPGGLPAVARARELTARTLRASSAAAQRRVILSAMSQETHIRPSDSLATSITRSAAGSPVAPRSSNARATRSSR